MRGHVSAEAMADFRAGLLPERKAAAISVHLSTCPRCAELDAQLASVTSLLAATPAPPMPAGLAARLDAALAAEAAARAAGTGIAHAASAPAPGTAPPPAPPHCPPPLHRPVPPHRPAPALHPGSGGPPELAGTGAARGAAGSGHRPGWRCGSPRPPRRSCWWLAAGTPSRSWYRAERRAPRLGRRWEPRPAWPARVRQATARPAGSRRPPSPLPGCPSSAAGPGISPACCLPRYARCSGGSHPRHGPATRPGRPQPRLRSRGWPPA